MDSSGLITGHALVYKILVAKAALGGLPMRAFR